MTINITLAGATGWVGKELLRAILAAEDLKLVGAVSRSAAGQDAGSACGSTSMGVTIAGNLEDALAVPSDVVIDYTKPHVVKEHAFISLARGRHMVIGTSGLTEDDYAEIDERARAAGRGVVAAGNFSMTATLMRRFAAEAARYVPDVEIIDYAGDNDIDLIVMGTHGGGIGGHLLLGSVAKKVVRRAPCPAMTVHVTGRQFVHS